MDLEIRQNLQTVFKSSGSNANEMVRGATDYLLEQAGTQSGLSCLIDIILDTTSSTSIRHEALITVRRFIVSRLEEPDFGFFSQILIPTIPSILQNLKGQLYDEALELASDAVKFFFLSGYWDSLPVLVQEGFESNSMIDIKISMALSKFICEHTGQVEVERFEVFDSLLSELFEFMSRIITASQNIFFVSDCFECALKASVHCLCSYFKRSGNLAQWVEAATQVIDVDGMISTINFCSHLIYAFPEDIKDGLDELILNYAMECVDCNLPPSHTKSLARLIRNLMTNTYIWPIIVTNLSGWTESVLFPLFELTTSEIDELENPSSFVALIQDYKSCKGIISNALHLKCLVSVDLCRVIADFFIQYTPKTPETFFQAVLLLCTCLTAIFEKCPEKAKSILQKVSPHMKGGVLQKVGVLMVLTALAKYDVPYDFTLDLFNESPLVQYYDALFIGEIIASKSKPDDIERLASYFGDSMDLLVEVFINLSQTFYNIKLTEALSSIVGFISNISEESAFELSKAMIQRFIEDSNSANEEKRSLSSMELHIVEEIGRHHPELCEELFQMAASILGHLNERSLPLALDLMAYLVASSDSGCDLFWIVLDSLSNFLVSQSYNFLEDACPLYRNVIIKDRDQSVKIFDQLFSFLTTALVSLPSEDVNSCSEVIKVLTDLIYTTRMCNQPEFLISYVAQHAASISMAGCCSGLLASIIYSVPEQAAELIAADRESYLQLLIQSCSCFRLISILTTCTQFFQPNELPIFIQRALKQLQGEIELMVPGVYDQAVEANSMHMQVFDRLGLVDSFQSYLERVNEFNPDELGIDFEKLFKNAKIAFDI